MTLSEEVRILGIDDFPHSRVSKGPVTVVCTLFRGSRLMDGLLSTTINYDGTGVTQKLTKLINSSKIKSQLHAIITDGVTFAGFNVLDINMLNRKTSVPVISVMRQIPNLKKIKRALKNVNNYANLLIICQKRRISIDGIFIYKIYDIYDKYFILDQSQVSPL